MKEATQKPPNVVLVMTDDQGYADLGCTGNPWIQTPQIDAFYQESIRLTDFHVSPLCTPTRGALMTGRRPVRNGAWATCWGRSILRKDQLTMADVFAKNGYRTGMFGKWHLGDNYPYRPQDRGFQKVVAHRGGGVGQTPDFWGNNYFNDTYVHNGDAVTHTGYCTDVWFEEATRFIEDNHDHPFFVYLSTNAPHDPYLVAESYTEPYAGNRKIPEPAFYGMISNIDENFGRLNDTLQRLGIAGDTILIFMTDNGSSGGCTVDSDERVTGGFNAGMRGKKGSYYDGGHRVPFFIRWPEAGIEGGRDLDDLALHIDLLPSLIDLCGLGAPDGVDFDGASLAARLLGRGGRLPDRTQFLQYRQSTEPPRKWECAVLTSRWRLVRGEELYDIKADPGQEQDLAHRHPEIVADLRGRHDAWWKEIYPDLDAYCPISIGSEHENPTRLDAMDVLGDVAWHQTHIAQAQRSTGRWIVDVERPGTYRISLRRWPSELGLPIEEVLPATEAQALIYGEGTPRGVRASGARIRLFGEEWQRPVEPGAVETTFDVTLSQSGITELEAWFLDPDETERGAYYVYVQHMS